MPVPSLLAVYAHPDDESLWSGGILAQHAAAGGRTAVVTTTWGADTPRAAELADALEILGAGKPRMLGYADARAPESAPGRPRLCDAPLDQTVRDLVTHLREFRPDIVITHDAYGGLTGHPDHLHTHRITLLAFHAAGLELLYPDTGAPWTPNALYLATHPHTAAQQLSRHLTTPGRTIHSVPDNQITATLDVTPWLEQKTAAILAHHTEVQRGAIPGLIANLPPTTRQQLLTTEHYTHHTPTTTPPPPHPHPHAKPHSPHKPHHPARTWTDRARQHARAAERIRAPAGLWDFRLRVGGAATRRGAARAAPQPPGPDRLASGTAPELTKRGRAQPGDAGQRTGPSQQAEHRRPPKAAGGHRASEDRGAWHRQPRIRAARRDAGQRARRPAAGRAAAARPGRGERQRAHAARVRAGRQAGGPKQRRGPGGHERVRLAGARTACIQVDADGTRPRHQPPGTAARAPSRPRSGQQWWPPAPGERCSNRAAASSTAASGSRGHRPGLGRSRCPRRHPGPGSGRGWRPKSPTKEAQP
ncbi:PIG-L deacetylase family protein [Streptomyces sp. BF23-30]